MDSKRGTCYQDEVKGTGIANILYAPASTFLSGIILSPLKYFKSQ
jgi:hypothetical protein